MDYKRKSYVLMFTLLIGILLTHVNAFAEDKNKKSSKHNKIKATNYTGTSRSKLSKISTTKKLGTSTSAQITEPSNPINLSGQSGSVNLPVQPYQMTTTPTQANIGPNYNANSVSSIATSQVSPIQGINPSLSSQLTPLNIAPVTPPSQFVSLPIQSNNNSVFSYDSSLIDYRSKTYEKASGSYTVKYKDATGVEQTQDIPIVMDHSDKEDLAKMSPESLAKMAQELMLEANNHSNQKGLKGNILVDTTLRFPRASATFFAGVGLVTLMDLMAEYEHNPVGLYQHFAAQKDPVTHISFYMFILASGAIQKPLSMFLRSPEWAARIPYLGMTVGMLASQLSSEAIAAFRECGTELMKSKNPLKSYPICQKNYNDFAVTEKIVDMAPSLVSMLLASQAAGFVQRKVTERIVAAKITTGIEKKLLNFALKWGGVKIALALTPGGGIRMVSQEIVMEVVQAFLFIGIQRFLDPWVITPYQNVLKGKNLDMLSDDIAEQIVVAKNDKWPVHEQDCAYSKTYTDPYALDGAPQKICDKSLIGNLKEFQTKMAAWRLLNLSKVMTAYQGWNQKIEKLSGMHEAAFTFYSYFLGEIQAAVDKRMNPYPQIWRTAPYNGVTPYLPPGYEQFPPETFLTSPENAELFQISKVKQTVTLIEQELNKGIFEVGGLLTQKLKKERNQMNQILVDLKSDKREEVVRALTKIHDLKTAFDPSSNTEVMRNLLTKIVDFMGLPDPDMVPGRAFLHAFKKVPTYKAKFEETEFPARPARYVLSELSEYFVHQMLCGPDIEKNENVVNETKGWRDELLPPQVRVANDKIFYFCDSSNFAETNRMFTDPLYVDTSKGRKVFKGPLDYLASQTRSSVLNGGFTKWWESGFKSQMDDALLNYDKQYDVIAKDFMKSALTKTFSYQDKTVSSALKGIWNEVVDGDFDFLNAGSVSNGAIFAVKQESRLYLLILNEMLKDLWIPKMKPEEVDSLVSTNQRDIITNPYLDNYNKDKIPLMSYLLYNAPVDFSRLVEATPSYSYNHKYSGHPSEAMIKSIQSVSDRFSIFFANFEALDVTSNVVSQKKKLLSIKSAVKEIDKAIKQLRTDLGIKAVANNPKIDSTNVPEESHTLQNLVDENSPKVELTPLKDILNPAQLKLAQVCVENLEKLQKESDNYARMLTFVDLSGESQESEDALKNSKSIAEQIKEKMKK